MLPTESKKSQHKPLQTTRAVAGLIVAVLGVACTGSVDRSTRPNIVLIVTDNQGLDAGSYGNPIIKTPNLDYLASDGIRMTHAFCTTASCSPSRSVILTGLYAHSNGMYGLAHDYHHFSSHDHIKSLPVLLGEEDYRTARVGKLHVEPAHVYRFDSVLEADSRNPVEMAEKSRPFIEESDNRPFFLYFCPYDPHRDRPFDTWPSPNSFANRPGGYPGTKPVRYKPEEVPVPPFLTDTPECRAELAQYYESISRVDQGLGRLLDILRETGQYNNTLIIYISDNGSAFPGALATLYEPGMHLPCIVRSPDQEERGITCDAMITWADLTPTILDFAGVSTSPDQFNGRSFKSALQNSDTAGWDEIYASHTFHEVTMYHPMRVVRGRQYKLIWNLAHEQEQPIPRDIKESTTWQALRRRGAGYLGKRPIKDFLHRPEFELYDLLEDPDEVVNLAGEPQYHEILTEMKQKLRSFQERTNDPWIITWEDHSGLEVVERH